VRKKYPWGIEKKQSEKEKVKRKMIWNQIKRESQILRVENSLKYNQALGLYNNLEGGMEADGRAVQEGGDIDIPMLFSH